MRKNIRNFCIIAHIDHGKSTLADRFLELTKTVEQRKMQDQLLDTMALERERGITIKLQPVRMEYEQNGEKFFMNLIDTPGHVDFTYEVSRTLKAVEGAILLVDAVKGIQAQTLSNLYLALEQDLKVIPAINKIDLPIARVEEVEKEIKELLGEDVYIHKISAKEGTGVKKLLDDVVENMPGPGKIPPDPPYEGGDGMQYEEELLKERGLISNGKHLPYNPKNVSRAKAMRKNMTEAECKLWFEYFKFLDDKVLKQRPIDNYIVDFYMPEFKLAVEVDGSGHFSDEGKGYDKEREEILRNYGVKVIRYNNQEVLTNIKRVSSDLEERIEELRKAKLERLPLFKGGQGGFKKQGITRALIFDSIYDDYQGVIAYIRVFDGELKKGNKIGFAANSTKGEVKEIGHFKPWLEKTDYLESGDIGFVVTGLKSLEDVRVGDTIYVDGKKPDQVLDGYKEPVPVVFASVFPEEGDEYDEFKDALLKLKLSDSSIEIKSETSAVLGRGFRIGLLGRLHLEIVKERLKRDSNVEVIVTQPSVAYKILKTSGKKTVIKSASEMPEDSSIVDRIWEPWSKVEVVTPVKYKGAVYNLVTSLRAEFTSENLVGSDRSSLSFRMPLSLLLTSLHDNLKSVSSGYASFSYEQEEWREADLVRLDFLVAEEKVEAFSKIVLKEDVFKEGKKMVDKLKDIIPRQNFNIKLQAVVGGKIVARQNIKAYRKDVIAKLYGGDYTRKQKLLKKQKKGKKKMNTMGKVQIPPDVFLKAAVED